MTDQPNRPPRKDRRNKSGHRETERSSSEAQDGITQRIAIARSSLPPVGIRVADFILERAEDVVHMSVTEVAEALDISEGSVIGFCQQIGARGFQHLKISLARDLVRPVQFIHEDLEQGDDTATTVGKIFRSGLQALEDTMRAVDTGQMNKAVDMILNADRVELFGIGSAAPIAQDAHYRMMRIGLDVRVHVDSHIQSIAASLTGPNVATLTISHSGSTAETVAATKLAKEAGAHTICITNFSRSPIHKYSDVVLHTVARETNFRTEAMTSRIAQLAVVDALIACLALQTYDKSIGTLQKTFDILSIKRL